MKNLDLCQKACTGQSVYGHALNRAILPLTFSTNGDRNWLIFPLRFTITVALQNSRRYSQEFKSLTEMMNFHNTINYCIHGTIHCDCIALAASRYVAEVNFLIIHFGHSKESRSFIFAAHTWSFEFVVCASKFDTSACILPLFGIGLFWAHACKLKREKNCVLMIENSVQGSWSF